jgi:SAM-dependent methyltransferase
MEAEFDTVAGWTQRVVLDLGPEYAIPAACRGSGDASWLEWIADGLQLEANERFLDAGAGLGGPAAWLREQRGLTPTLAEPMEGACAGALGLFGMPTVAAWSEALPFGNETFDAAWLLGVLCTTRDKVDLLRELRRVLTLDGRLGLLVLVQVADELVAAPEGNEFPTATTLPRDLRAAGFVIDSQIEVSALPPAGDGWQRRVQRVEDTLQQRYGAREAWQTAQQQADRIGRLLREGQLETWLLTTHVG